MTRTVYLEAATVTQDLLTAKWMLRSCGYSIASTWHEDSTSSSGGAESRGTWRHVEEMRSCDALVVVCMQEKTLPLELAFTLGFAAAHNLRVIWLGSPIDLPGISGTIDFHSTFDEFRKELLMENAPAQTPAAGNLLAA